MAVITPIDAPPTEELQQFYERGSRASRGLGVLNVFTLAAYSPELMQSWWQMMVVRIANWNLMAHLLLPLQIELEPAAREYLSVGCES
jgi:hypothetical protein